MDKKPLCESECPFSYFKRSANLVAEGYIRFFHVFAAWSRIAYAPSGEFLLTDR